MTDEEKTELRIRAWYALGSGEEIPPTDWEGWGTVSQNTYQEAVASLPDPLTNAEDCEALLVATLSRESVWRFDLPLACHAWEGDARKSIVHMNHGMFSSDNPDPTAAYRESVTRACVAAWEAEQSSMVTLKQAEPSQATLIRQNMEAAGFRHEHLADEELLSRWNRAVGNETP